MAEGVAGYTPSAAGLPTLAVLRSRVYAPLRDDERAFVTEWYVNQLLNEAYVDLCARLRLKRGSVTSTTSTTGTITMPSDLVEITNLWVGAIRPDFVDDDTFLSYANPATTVPAADPLGLSTTIARVAGTTIETYPELSSLSYTLEYVARPVEMVADTDTPVDLTLELIPRIVNYARAYGKWQEGAQQEGQVFMALYEQGLPGAPREAFRRRPQSLTLTVEPGPFDGQDAY